MSKLIINGPIQLNGQVLVRSAKNAAFLFCYGIRGFLSQYPSVYLPMYRWRPRFCNVTIGKDFEIVIEGFPRSANTFAVMAFELAQRQRIKIAHHLHAAAQIIAAARWNIPALVLIRNPDEVILSVIAHNPYVTLGEALREYVRFYERIQPYKEYFVVALFDEVINDFGAVIHKVNNRFKTNFREFDHTDTNVRRTFELIDKGAREKHGKMFEIAVGRPSEKRKEIKEKLRKHLRVPRWADRLHKARRIYEVFKSYAIFED